MNWPGLTPLAPKAGPIGGAGVAVPPGACILNFLTTSLAFAMTRFPVCGYQFSRRGRVRSCRKRSDHHDEVRGTFDSIEGWRRNRTALLSLRFDFLQLPVFEFEGR